MGRFITAQMQRRACLCSVSVVVAFMQPTLATSVHAGETNRTAEFRIASFSTDVTPPPGHPLLAGQVPDAKGIADPLFANGFVLTGPMEPIVYVAVDWCEIRNDAYARWQSALAEAAQTTPQRVLVSSVHQHDAPLADLGAETIVRKNRLAARIIDPDFHERTVTRVAAALKFALAKSARVSHIGIGQARVEKVASNRRYVGPDHVARHDRMSSTRDAAIRNQPEGVIDPWLKVLSFWSGDRPVVALSTYSVHPMSYYGTAQVSADFVGLARRRFQADTPGVLQIYASGCSGNTVAGKYNDGNPANREVLADRLYQAMTLAWRQSQKLPLEWAKFQSAEVQLEPRSDERHSKNAYLKQLTAATPVKTQSLAALGYSWQIRVEAGKPIEIPMVDFGPAQLLLLPGESYVEYQLFAQSLRPKSFVMALGYGECAPGYVPTDRAWAEKDANLGSWCWVAPGAEAKLKHALSTLLVNRP